MCQSHLRLDVIDAHFLAIGWHDFSASRFGSGPVDTKWYNSNAGDQKCQNASYGIAS
jgi:hypothetical protein